MTAKYLTVSTPWGGEDVGILFCPVCGRKVTSKRHCNHVLFLFLDELGDFEWVSPSLAEARKSLKSKKLANPTRAFAKAIQRDSVVCFYFTPNVTGGGIGIAIDFAADTESG
jgi:hypothetical protein